MLSLAMSATRQLVVLLPCAWLFSRIGQLDQVWYAFLVSEVVSVTMSLLMYRAVYRNRMRPLPVGESA